MKRLVALILIASLFPPLNAICAFTDDQTGDDPKVTPRTQCKDGGSDCPLIYPSIGAAYVGGTIQGMPLTEGNLASWLPRALHIIPRQHRAKGHVALGRNNFVFVYHAGAGIQSPKGANFSSFSCGQVPTDSTDAYEACQEFDNGRPQGWNVVQVSYDKIIVLSRAKVDASDYSSISTAYATAGVGILAGVVGAFSSAHGKELYGGITAGFLALVYWLLIAHPRAGDYYVALFVAANTTLPVPTNLTATAGDALVVLSWTTSKDANSYNVLRSLTAGGPFTQIASGVTTTTYTDTGLTNGATYYYAVQSVYDAGKSANSTPVAAIAAISGYCSACEKAAEGLAASSSSEKSLFKQGDLIMFRVPNYHDYYNISLILSAKTGLTSVSETAEKTGK